MVRNLQQKINTLTNSNEGNVHSQKYSNLTMENNENLVKHKDSEIKKLKYELELSETSILTQEKTIK